EVFDICALRIYQKEWGVPLFLFDHLRRRSFWHRQGQPGKGRYAFALVCLSLPVPFLNHDGWLRKEWEL
ncbi:MAG: hypothetical protein AAF329_05815, partial [Cyanobacteria bacterium P01_A01_bin.17]